MNALLKMEDSAIVTCAVGLSASGSLAMDAMAPTTRLASFVRVWWDVAILAGRAFFDRARPGGRKEGRPRLDSKGSFGRVAA